MSEQNKDRDYFLICGNERSGSTYLTLLLSSLPDVTADFEFQWKPKFRTITNAHKIIPSRNAKVRTMLDHAFPDSQSPIFGSKLVFSKRYYNPFELADMIISVDQNIKIIHLQRDPAELVKSTLKAQGHVMVEPEANQKLQNPNAKIYSENKRVYESMDQSKRIKQRANINQIIWIVLCVRQIERFCFLFKKTHKNYLFVDYKDINERWNEICDFIGTQTTAEERKRCLESSLLKKNPHMDLGEIYSNAQEVEDLIDALTAPTKGESARRVLRLYGLRTPFVVMGYLWSRFVHLLFGNRLKTRVKLLFTRP